jgi:peptide/nickel transport system permease protein
MKQLLKHIRLILALAIIIPLCFGAIFAYSWIPDKSTNANAMQLSLSNLVPNIEQQFLLLPAIRQSEISDSFWFGKSQSNRQLAIDSFYIESNDIVYWEKGINRSNRIAKEELLYPDSIQKNIIRTNYILGSDKYGRDFLSRLVLGARVSLLAGFFAVIISLLIGLVLGLISGYFGSWIDRIIMWFINVLWSVPTLLLAIAITLSLGKGLWQVFLAIGLSMWVEIARMVRGSVMQEKEQTYAQALNSLGFSSFRILFRHILPNIFQPVIVICAANFATAILLEAGLSFLGIGATAPIPTWGNMIRDHYAYIVLDKAYLAVYPGLGIMLLVIAFMLLGNYLKDRWAIN